MKVHRTAESASVSTGSLVLQTPAPFDEAITARDADTYNNGSGDVFRFLDGSGGLSSGLNATLPAQSNYLGSPPINLAFTDAGINEFGNVNDISGATMFPGIYGYPGPGGFAPLGTLTATPLDGYSYVNQSATSSGFTDAGINGFSNIDDISSATMFPGIYGYPGPSG
ncbi:hypothetical protein P152DRAFT_474689, partial [Eremomyces bilateralis CBS 781.70]